MATFTAGNKGRPKGAKGKKTVARESVTKTAVAAVVKAATQKAVPAPVAAPAAVGVVAPVAKWAERAGVDTKTALLNIMRRAYDDLCEAQDQLDVLLPGLAALKATTGDASITELERVTAAAGAEVLQKRVDTLRSEVSAHRALCSQHANMVIPYEYARLQANTNKQVGDIIVRIKDFGAGPKQEGGWKKSFKK